MNIKEKIASRKLFMTLFSVVIIGLLAWHGDLSGELAARNIIYIAGIYVVGQSFVDGQKGAGVLGSLLSESSSKGKNNKVLDNIITALISGFTDKKDGKHGETK